MLDKSVKKKIERAFYEYLDSIKLDSEYLDSLAYEGITVAYGAIGGRSGKIGNPTEAKAIRVASSERDTRWNMVVEKTLSWFEAEKRRTNIRKDELIRLRYFQKMREKDTCFTLFIERETMYRWVNEITTYATMIAIELGLINFLKEG